MSENTAAEKWVEVYAEEYRDRSPHLDESNSVAEAAQHALEIVLGTRDSNGKMVSKNQREIEEAQDHLRDGMGLSGLDGGKNDRPDDPVAAKQAELKEQMRGN